MEDFYLSEFKKTTREYDQRCAIKYHRLRGNIGSYMIAHKLLDLLDELRNVIKCEACRAFCCFFHNEFNKFDHTGTRI